MTIGDLDEAIGVLNRLLARLLGTLSGDVGRQGAALRYAIGDLRASGAALLQAGTLGLPLLNVFQLAYYAGSSLADMEVVRLAMAAESPIGIPGSAVANAGIRFALGREARILASTTFTSSQDVFAALAQINASFDAATEHAADTRDPAAYQALITLHAAVVRDLTTRGASLPALVTYRVGRVMTSHTLANRLYGDASRCDELRAEGKILHPAFVPPVGTALSE